jgi:peptidoglycan glycosyltransferase
VGAVANGGVCVQPHIVETINVGSNVSYRAGTEKNERILSKNTAKILQEYMASNVQVKYGAENFPGLTVCAKSGTGEVGGNKAPNAMFTGFLADEEYPLAFIVAVEEGGYGTRTCVPILTQVLETCIRVMDTLDW